MRLAEVRELSAELLTGGALDYLDLSLWDVRKAPVEPEFAARGNAPRFLRATAGVIHSAPRPTTCPGRTMTALICCACTASRTRASARSLVAV